MKTELRLDLPVKPSVRLLGHDGNAFAIIGTCVDALKEEMVQSGFERPEITAATTKLRKAMMAGDYDRLLAIAAENFDVC